MRRALHVVLALSLVSCGSDPAPIQDVGLGDKPLTGDVPAAGEGLAKDLPVAQPETSTPPGDLVRLEGTVTPDKGKSGDKSVADKGASSDGPGSCGKIRCDCYAFSTKQNKWIPLFGKSNQVSALPDFKVKIVNFGGALKVKQAVTYPQKCGEWQNVTIAPSFTYQIVTIAEDFTIQYDQIFPGINTVACPACK